METGNKDKKIGIAAYECIGTALITYGFMVVGESATSAISITFAMTILAWNVSGGHFNPVISVAMYISEKDFGGNIVTLIILVGSQFIGAFLGVLLGYLALIDKEYQEALAD
jgi:glycerol uptake facilitator-like aquaporin